MLGEAEVPAFGRKQAANTGAARIRCQGGSISDAAPADAALPAVEELTELTVATGLVEATLVLFIDHCPMLQFSSLPAP